MSLKHRLLVVGFSLGFFCISAQSITSPYTNFGIGELNDFALPHQFGMANVGNSVSQPYYINLQNPALLTNNVLTSFQVGLKGESRSYQTDNFSTTDKTGSISHMVLAVPLKIRKWTSAVSLLPYSSVNYNLVSKEPIDGVTDSATHLLKGSGGLSQLSWSHGVRITENLTLGLRASYVFGSISRSVTNSIYTLPSLSGFSVSYEEFVNYSDIIFSGAFAYKIPINDSKNLQIGLIYDFWGNLNGIKSTSLVRQTPQGDDFTDRIYLVEDSITSFSLPSRSSFGISYESPNKLLVGLDVGYLQWNTRSQNKDSSTKNALSIAFGGQYTPNYKDVNNYFKRMDYRFGASFQQLPYIVNGADINEIGINFGVSLPTKNFSSIDTGFRFGTRGEIAENLIRENFVQVLLGLTINDRWFIKRRYD